MKVAGILIIFLLLLFPAWGKEKVYVAKSKKSITYKKKKKRYVRYPVRVNTSVSGEKLKLKDMLKDIYE